MVMFNWLKKWWEPKVSHITIVGMGPVNVSVERLENSFALHMTGEAQIDDDTGSTARFAITINDTKSLKDLCGMVHTALQRTEPPYYAEADAPPFPDENPNIYEDVRETLGPEFAKTWIHEPNLHLGGQSPHQVIRDGRPHWVRDILRQIKHVGIS